MKLELQNKLFQRFPNLFIERNLPMTQTCMCWGIETGNGWFNLIWNLCGKLEKFKGLRFTQVKEKFGGLRVYYDFEPKRFFRGLNAKQKRKFKRQYKTIDYLISEAERIAFETCQYCENKLETRYNEDEAYWFAKKCENCK